PDLDATEAERRQPQFLQGKAEKPSSVDRKAKFAKAVRTMMSMPEEKRAEVTTTKKEQEGETGDRESETFLKEGLREVHSSCPQGARSEKKRRGGAHHPTPRENEPRHPTQQGGGDGDGHDLQGAPLRKLRTAVHAITLLQERQKTLQAVKLARAKGKGGPQGP
ncbi:hypothetical protein CEXT_793601, partial [Caerostris extrusa]